MKRDVEHHGSRFGGDRRRRVFTALLILIPAGALGLIGYRWIGTPRQSAVRLVIGASLKGIRTTIDVFASDNGRLPASFDELIVAGLLTADHAKPFVYVGNTGGVLAYQKTPCRAVRAGEPWGGPGERTPVAIPAARFVLLDGQDPVLVNEVVFQQAYASLLSKTPTQ